MNFVKLDIEKSKMILHSQQLKEMVKDGSFAKISKKWFDMDVCILEP